MNRLFYHACLSVADSKCDILQLIIEIDTIHGFSVERREHYDTQGELRSGDLKQRVPPGSGSQAFPNRSNLTHQAHSCRSRAARD